MGSSSVQQRARVLAMLVTFALGVWALAGPAYAATGPYEHAWRVQGEVGGDRGGASTLAVLTDTMALESVAGGYRGSVVYADRLAVRDASGAILVQRSDMKLLLVGAPASGGAALGGTFSGTARLDYFTVASWADAAAGRLPARPSGTVTYDVLGHWGARMVGSTARGELEFGSATPRTQSGTAMTRDASWFVPADASAQLFTVEVVGAVSQPDGTGDSVRRPATATTLLDYMRRGISGEWSPVVAVPAESAVAARILRDAKPVGATLLPPDALTIDLDVAGHVLDAKNRAAGTLPTSAAGKRAADLWAADRERTDAGALTPREMARVLDGLLATQTETGGARELRAQVGGAMASSSAGPLASAARIAEWYHVARALGDTGPSRGVLATTFEAARAVADSRVKAGTPLADAVLAAADALDAPEAARNVRAFARVKASDLTAAGPSAGAVSEAISAAGLTEQGRPAVSWTSADGTQRVAPESWLAYRRADAETFFLPGDAGTVALTDGTLSGWAFGQRRAYVVEAGRVGRLLAILPTTVRP
ncbi:MAG: hypothetical protein Q7W16_06045 [Coriobacteriia bacterium]|nr:hypothetical protein [Coriobacteriia bacterium]